MILKYWLSVPLFVLMLVLSSATVVKNQVFEIVEDNLSGLATNKVGFNSGMGITVLEEVREEKLKKGIYIHGRISSESGKPLYQAVVEVLNKNIVSTTDWKGEYEINASAGDKLKFSAEGFETVTITLDNKSVVNIILKRVPSLSLSEKADKIEGIAIVGRNEANGNLNSDEVFNSAEENPMYPGGVKELFAFINKNLKYPIEAQHANISGKVFARFVVRQDGSISDIKILKGIGFGCDEETVRVIAQMPKWKPGMQNGHPVNVHFTVPINFTMEERELAEIKSIPQSKTRSPLTGISGTQNTSIRWNGINDPLIILDGVEVKSTSIREIPSDGIEKIDVLKSESATKQYGIKGINGVVIITTGKPSLEEVKVNPIKD